MSDLKKSSHPTRNGVFFLVFILFSLFIALAPSFDLLSWAIRYDEKRILQLAVLLLAALCITSNRQLAIHYSQSLAALPILTRYALLLIFLIALLSSFFAPSPDHAYRETFLFTLLFSFSLYVATLIKNDKPLTLNIFLIGLLCSIFFYEVTFFTAYFSSIIQNNPLVWPEPFSNFSSVRFLNQFQIWTLPLIIMPLILYREKLNPRLFIFIFILGVAWWTIVFASHSRGILLAILAASLLTLLIFRKHAWPLIKLLGISALLGGMVYLLLFVYLPAEPQGVRITQLFSDNARITLWTSALQMVLDHPLLGVGPGHYAYYPNDIAAHPHNALFQIMSEWGIPVATLFLLLISWGGIVWCKQFYRLETIIQDNRKKHLWIALFCSATAGIAYSMVSGVIVMPLSQIMFAAIIGIMLGLYNFTIPTTNTFSPVKLILLRLMLVGLSVFMIRIITPDIIIRIETPSPPYNDTSVMTYGPRFWQEGGIPH